MTGFDDPASSVIGGNVFFEEAVLTKAIDLGMIAALNDLIVCLVAPIAAIRAKSRQIADVRWRVLEGIERSRQHFNVRFVRAGYHEG